MRDIHIRIDTKNMQMSDMQTERPNVHTWQSVVYGYKEIRLVLENRYFDKRTVDVLSKLRTTSVTTSDSDGERLQC
jgi:hypothetical protein